MFYLRLGGAIIGFVGASIYGILLVVLRRDPTRVARDYARMLVRLMRPPLGLRTEVAGAEHLESRRPCVYVANHQSMYDVPILAELYPKETVVVGKRELRKIPFFGWLFTASGNLLIDRRDNPRAVERLKEAEDAIDRRGVSVWIFPEGTRGTEPGRLLPFKKGAFYMAVAAGVPLVPIVVEPLARFFDAERRRIRPGTIRVRILEPIETKGLTDADVPHLIVLTRGVMQTALTEMTRPELRG